MKTITLSIYAALLRLYPAQFREMFGDEMLETFALAYRVQQPLGFCLRELGGLLRGILHEQRDTMLQEMSTVGQARLITRVASLLLALFFALVSIDSRSTLSQIMAVFSLLQMIAVLAAWRWELEGGLLIIGVGVVSSAMVTLSTGEFFSVYPFATIFFSALRSLPFFLFGAMFALLSHTELRSETA